MADDEEASAAIAAVEEAIMDSATTNDNNNNSPALIAPVINGADRTELPPPAKKPRLSNVSNSNNNPAISTRERNKYKGMRIRQCLCGKPECLPRLKAWIDLGDSKRQGFKELPRQSSKTTPVGLEKNRIRDVMFLHMKGCRAPRYDESDKTNRERKLFVAFHHFHPLLLQDENKGPYQYVHFELAERIGGFAERDTVQNLPGVVFHPIPNYPKEDADADFEEAGGIEQQRYARPRKLSDAKPKTSPSIRSRVRDVLGQMEHDPLKVANDYLEMQERLRKLEDQKPSSMMGVVHHHHAMDGDDGGGKYITEAAEV